MAAIFVQEVGDLRPLSGKVLVRLYGLTPAETRLLGLLTQDCELDESVRALGIAIMTARTHLQHIVQNSGKSRQSQLMKLELSASPAGVP